MVNQSKEALFLENSVIENIGKKSFNFKTMDEINNYKRKTVTQQALEFATQVYPYLKIVGDNRTYYYESKRLWVEIDDKQFESFVYDFYDKSACEIKKILKKLSDDAEDDDDDDGSFKTTKKQIIKY